ncbi:MAG TPA: histidine kinase dimerization/phospho-acceptor domain-containing protein [Anaerolineales bacterium]
MNEPDSQNPESNHNSDEWKSWPPEFFLSVLFYELRTPLIAIKGYTTILSDEKAKEHHPQALEKIFKNVERIEKLCEGIADYRTELEKKLDT